MIAVIDDDIDIAGLVERERYAKASRGHLLDLRAHEAWPDEVDANLDRKGAPGGFCACAVPEVLLVIDTIGGRLSKRLVRSACRRASLVPILDCSFFQSDSRPVLLFSGDLLSSVGGRVQYRVNRHIQKLVAQTFHGLRKIALRNW
jgi:hypothetical protein